MGSIDPQIGPAIRSRPRRRRTVTGEPFHRMVTCSGELQRLAALALTTHQVNASTAKSRRYSAIAKRSVMPAT